MDRRSDADAVVRQLPDTLSRLGVERGAVLLVAFSGGPDSTALAWGLSKVRDELDLELRAVHVDHGLDVDSSRRARRARQLADALGIGCEVERLDTSPGPGDSHEAWARTHRYAVLERHAEAFAATDSVFIATAHHADDQAETLILRLLFGSGLDGMAGIRPRHGRLIRPLLDLRRSDLDATIRAADLEPIRDPTNADLRVPRNRIRHRLIPELQKDEPCLIDRLTSVADATRTTLPRIDTVLVDAIAGRSTIDGATCDRIAFATLPTMLRPSALAALERLAHRPLPTPTSSRIELSRQLDSRRDHVGCDAGDGWRWHGDRTSLRLLAPVRPTGQFTYTLEVPGTVVIPDLGLELRIDVGPIADWMFRGHTDRVALAPIHSTDPSAPTTVQIRNRRPGDRIRPLGSRRSKRLKDLLIDRRIPRERRDRLPLLIVNDIVAWVPGVALDDRFRLDDETTAWIAELRPTGRAERPFLQSGGSATEKTEKGRTP